MKCFVVLLGLSAVLAICLGDSSQEEKMKKMGKIFHHCQEDSKLSKDEMQTLKESREPTSQEQKCFVGCFMEKIGLINKDGFDRVAADKISNEMFTGDKLAKSLEANENCKNEVEHVADKCVTGPEVLRCLRKYMPYFKED